MLNMTIPDQLLVEKFQPLRLHIDRIGPFQDAPYMVDFTDSHDEPCNLFLLLSKNGNGKTTILQLVQQLIQGVLPPIHSDNQLLCLRDHPQGRAQLDVFLVLKWNDTRMTAVLSLLSGTTSLAVWTEAALEKYGAKDHYTVNAMETTRQWLASPENMIKQLRNDIAVSHRNASNTADFMQPSDTLPSVLLFPIQRHISLLHEERPITRPNVWGYSLVYDAQEGVGAWNQSLDNLLVWMKWLDNGSLERAIGLVNDYLFAGDVKFLEGVRKDPPEAIVNNGGHRHRLDQLSSGEQSVVQLLLRIGAHITQNSIILIDELELHLHPNWQHKLLSILKKLVRDYPQLIIIASTHSREILGAFPLDIEEQGVRKGGDIIQGGFE
jgi:energy-coupling factor transporter ATP-binding protein EcfA2